jgi:hypothetical protein
MEPEVSITRRFLQIIPYMIAFEIVLVLAISIGYGFSEWPGAFFASSLAVALIHILGFVYVGKYATVPFAVALLTNGLITSLVSEIFYPTHSFQLVLLKLLLFTPVAFYLVFFTLIIAGFLLIFIFGSIFKR